MLTLTPSRILLVLTLTMSLRGGTPTPTTTPPARPTGAPATRFVDDTEGCREQPVAAPVAPATCS